MQDEPYYTLGRLDGSDVGVQPTVEGQDIWIRHTSIGQRLACLLAMGQTDIVRRGWMRT